MTRMTEVILQICIAARTEPASSFQRITLTRDRSTHVSKVSPGPRVNYFPALRECTAFEKLELSTHVSSDFQ